MFITSGMLRVGVPLLFIDPSKSTDENRQVLYMFSLNRIGENTPGAVAPVVNALIEELTEKFLAPVLATGSRPEEVGQVFRDAVRIAAIHQLVEQRIAVEKRAYRLGDLLEFFNKDDGRAIANSVMGSLYALHHASDFLEMSNPLHHLPNLCVRVDGAQFFKAVRKYKPLRSQPLIPYFHHLEVSEFVIGWFEALGAETRVYGFQKHPPRPSVTT